MDGQGVTISGITTDIYGYPRQNPPAIGCYEPLPACSTPIMAAGGDGLGIAFTPTSTSVTGSFNSAAPFADHYLIVRNTTGILNANPTNVKNYNPGDTLGTGGQATVVTYMQDDEVSYDEIFTDNGLTPATHYYYYIFAANSNGCNFGPAYLTSNGSDGNLLIGDVITGCGTPTAQPTNLMLTPGSTTVSGSFTVSTADHYLIVRNTSGVAPTPINGTTYNPNDPLGDGFVVEYQSGNTIADAGLLGNTLYHYFVFAANSSNCYGGPAFLATSPLTSTVTTNCAAPAAQPTNILLTPAYTTVTGSFTPETTADHYLIVRSTSSIAPTPINGTTYNPNDALGSGFVVAYQTGTTVSDAGLNSGLQFYYFIYAANSICTGGPAYLAASPLTGIITTNIPPATNKTLNVTAMLQEYFNGTGMNQTQGIDWNSGNLFNNFSGTIVDTLTVLIRQTNVTDPFNPCTIDTALYAQNINVDGTISPISIPASITGYNYIVIIHRNSIETWSDSVDFSTDTINYNFYTHLSQFAQDGGMLIDGSNHAYIWGGDVNQNGNLESEDATQIYVAAISDDETVNNGYVINDVDGNGNIDSQDYGLAYSNSLIGANVINPFSYQKKK